jgi:hypothetical protein
MTSEERLEIGSKLKEIGELLANFEHKAEMRLATLHRWIRESNEERAEFRDALCAVLERIDRFIQGREGDGHKA